MCKLLILFWKTFMNFCCWYCFNEVISCWLMKPNHTNNIRRHVQYHSYSAEMFTSCFNRAILSMQYQQWIKNMFYSVYTSNKLVQFYQQDFSCFINKILTTIIVVTIISINLNNTSIRTLFYQFHQWLVITLQPNKGGHSRHEVAPSGQLVLKTRWSRGTRKVVV